MPSIDRRDCIPIPQPRSFPFTGNAGDIDRSAPVYSYMKLAQQYGPIFALQLAGKHRVFINSYELISELVDEKRFVKCLTPALRELRNAVGDALFTSDTDEFNWQLAHRVLTPAFGPLNLRNMFPQMFDIASQCVLRWARFGPEHIISVSDDWTRLTLDTLALTSMGYRFNSFYTESMNPFIASFARVLDTAAARTFRPPLPSAFYRSQDARYFEDIKYMRQVSADLIDERLAHPTDNKDLLSAMLEGIDSQTGKKLTHESIIDNMITFLVAGHETTSGLLGFATYYLLKNPEAYRKAQAEIDHVLQGGNMRPEHLNKLPYLSAVLRETLRLCPTAPIWSLKSLNPAGEVIGGKYFIDSKDVVSINLSSIHRDPAVYGDDVETFRPERMLDKAVAERPVNAFMPFGNGARACIGRHFAWQEALLSLATTIQYFDLEMADPQYVLAAKQGLTQKPIHFDMRAKLRPGISVASLEQRLTGSNQAVNGVATNGVREKTPTSEAGSVKPMTVLYGSNCGTCEAFARTIANDAAAHGFKASNVATLDSAKGALPTDQPIVMVTASYEGTPCDNAKHFFTWLDNLAPEEKLNISYAVFGAGHSDWKTTFYKIPTAIDNSLAAHGGKRICAMGNANAANGDMMTEFQSWEDEIFWPALTKQHETKSPSAADNVEIEVSNSRAATLRAGVLEAKVIEAKTLTAPGVPEKRHLEIKLPSSMTYNAGDYVAVLPLNPEDMVRRVMNRFGLPWDAVLKIKSTANTMLPTENPVSAHDLFSAYLELSQPATKRDLALLMDASESSETQNVLQELLRDFSEEITKKRVSLLDLLDRFPSVSLPLNAFVGALVPMRVRQYSISSSPLAHAGNLTISYAVLDQIALSGHGRYQGVASTYLSDLRPGDSLHVAIKPSSQAFHLPSNAEHTPVIMICAGTGLAPFRSFVQERSLQLAAGRKLAAAHLFVGCRHPDQDEIYREEMASWEGEGAVTIHRAYSKAPERSEGHKYAQDALWSAKTLLQDLWDADAKVFVCGSRQLGESVRQISIDIFKDGCERKGEKADDERASAWFDRVRNERYATDVFA